MVSVVNYLKTLILTAKIEADREVPVVNGCAHSDERSRTKKEWQVVFCYAKGNIKCVTYPHSNIMPNLQQITMVDHACSFQAGDRSK